MKGKWTDQLAQLTEDQLTLYILAFFGFCMSGLPGLVFSGLTHVSILGNVTFAALVAAAAYGFLQIVLSSRFLHKAEKAHFLLVPICFMNNNIRNICLPLRKSILMIQYFFHCYRPLGVLPLRWPTSSARSC